MMKILLLSLLLGVAHGLYQFQGRWKSLAMASDYNMDRIREGGPLRCYFRDIRCSQNCDVLHIKFYKKHEGGCQIIPVLGEKGPDGFYKTDYSGQNEYDFIYTSKTMLIIKNVNTDGDKVTSVILALGKGHGFHHQDEEKFVQVVEENGISRDNIEYFFDSDTCPE